MEEETSHYLNTWHFYLEKGENFKLHTTVGPVWLVQHKHISTVVKKNLVRFILSSFVSLNNSDWARYLHFTIFSKLSSIDLKTEQKKNS
jgi:hypothetical protein